MKQEIKILEHWGKFQKPEEKFAYKFLVDNHDQLGWIIDKIIKILNSNEWRKIKKIKKKIK